MTAELIRVTQYLPETQAQLLLFVGSGKRFNFRNVAGAPFVPRKIEIGFVSGRGAWFETC